MQSARIVAVIDVTNGEVLATHATVAETMVARFLGLQGRRALAAGAGLVLLPNNGIHMFFMRFRIDAVFVGHNRRVLRVARALRPWTVGPLVPGALYCVELPAGAAAHTRLGDEIDLQPASIPVSVEALKSPRAQP